MPPKLSPYTFADSAEIEREATAIIELIKQQNWANEAISLIGDYEYQGLDVKAIIRTIYARGFAHNRTADDIKEDIWRMILLFLCRGNNIDKMLARSKTGTVTAIQGYKTNYELQNRVGRGGADRLTLSRIAAVFPGVTLALLSHDTVSVHIPRAVPLSTVDFGDNFPKVMQTVIAASIFPKGKEGIKLMQALLLYMIEENKLLSRNNSTQSDATILAEVMKYAKASFMSTVLAFSSRLEVAVARGMIVENQVASNIAIASNSFVRKHGSVDFTFMN